MHMQIMLRRTAFTFSSTNETAVRTTHLWIQRIIAAQRVRVSGWQAKRVEKLKEKVHCLMGRGGQNYQLHSVAQGRPEEGIRLPAIFPLGAICNYYHSSLIFNSFY